LVDFRSSVTIFVLFKIDCKNIKNKWYAAVFFKNESNNLVVCYWMKYCFLIINFIIFRIKMLEKLISPIFNE